MTACCTPFVIPRFVVGGAGDGNRTYHISLRLRRRRLRKADVRFRPAKVSNGLRIQPIDHLLLNGDFQYIQDIQVNSLNGAFAATETDVPVLQSVLTLSAKRRPLRPHENGPEGPSLDESIKLFSCVLQCRPTPADQSRRAKPQPESVRRLAGHGSRLHRSAACAH